MSALPATESSTGDWLAALRQLVPIPAPHRDESLDRAAALQILRCPEEELDRVVAEGFPCSGAGEA